LIIKLLYVSENEYINQNTRYIDIKYHCVKNLIRENNICLNYIKSQDNLTNGFIKYLNSNAMKKFRNSIIYEY